VRALDNFKKHSSAESPSHEKEERTQRRSSEEDDYPEKYGDSRYTSSGRHADKHAKYTSDRHADADKYDRHVDKYGSENRRRDEDRKYRSEDVDQSISPARPRRRKDVDADSVSSYKKPVEKKPESTSSSPIRISPETQKLLDNPEIVDRLNKLPKFIA
jgi:hypothetical protein